MLSLNSISIGLQLLVHVYAYLIKDIVENTGMTPTDWKLDNNTPYTSTTFCTESHVGPYLGLLDSNIKRSFTNVRPHYSITLSLDIYYTEYWGALGNYFKIMFDGTQIFRDSNILTSSLSSPSTYCLFNNLYGTLRNNQLTTIRSTMTHQNINFLLQVQGSFNCMGIYYYNDYCEKAGIKNFFLYIEECHESCLTCTGPLKTDCLTCPSGIAISGQCSCGALLVSQNQCVASCSANQEVVSGYCVESCGTNCLDCVNQICSLCQIGYQLYQGKCLSSCPSYSVTNGTNCDDLTTISNLGSEYLGKYFYTLEKNIVDDLTPFTFISNSGNSWLTGQKYCIYGDLFILGGIGVWADGIFRISYSSLSPHNMVRIQMKVYFIDSWNGEEFVVRVDGVQVYSKTVISSHQTHNLMFRDAKDRIEPVTLAIPHISSSLIIEFESKLTQSAFIASAGITDLFILIDYCDTSCAVCGSTQCTLCLSPYTLIGNQCLSCGIATLRNQDCSCMDGYFEDSQISCQQCSIQCSSCSLFSSCTNCNIADHFINLPNCNGCEQGYYYTSSNECLPCISNCIICDNSETCFQCKEGFYQNENYICVECSQNCKSCNLRGCLICELDYGLNSLLQCVYCNSNEILIAGNCQLCQSKCLTCLDQLENCQTCSFPRVNPPNCQCQDGYFESSGQCQLCHQRCMTCELEWKNCITCMAGRINTPKCDCSSDAICEQCEDGFFRHTNLTCIQCSQNCTSCNSSGCQICQPYYGLNIQLECVSCNSNETVITGQCQQCQSQCLSCLYQLDNCLTCSFPRVNAPNCLCQDGYFELSNQCVHCHQLCATCVLSETNCISCMPNRINAPKCDCTSDQICEQCQQGFYRDTNLTCIECSQNCKNCNSNGCQICNTNYGLNNALQCVTCNSNETVIAGYCEQCESQCLTCFGQVGNCLTCLFPRDNAPNCQCQDGYFELLGQCHLCSQLCATCEFSQSNCITCAPTIINAPKCDCSSNNVCEQCQVGFYRNLNLMCTECSQNCLSCNSSGCLICQANYGLTIQLQCAHCNSNETVIAGHCEQCSHQCLSCLNQLNNCLTCPFPRVNAPNCLCQDGYFELLGECQVCSPLCATCEFIQTNCITCASNKINAPKCDCSSDQICDQCQVSFYRNSNLTCTECSQNCLSCNLFGCQICEANYGLTIDLKCAQCNLNETVIAGYCELCQYQCLSCLGWLDNCLTCPYPRVNAPTCQCQDGYYESSKECQHCSQLCATCKVSQNNCITCAANRINPPKCDCYANAICEQCQVGFYRNTNLKCIECSQNCKSCTYSGCQICEANYGLTLDLQCIYCNSHETVIAGYCQQCSSQCLYCLEQVDNCQTCPFPRINPPNCQCQDGYFEFSGQCQHCNKVCATCELNKNNCISCAANRINAPECDCPSDGISQIERGIVWCQACESAILDIYFNDDLTSLIIDFGTNLYRDEYLNCSQILLEETVNLLGLEPTCYTNFNQLNILLDYNATINLNDLIYFKHQTNFIFQDCLLPIKYFLHNQVGLPKTSIAPKILFNLKQVKYISGLKIDMQIMEEQVTGMRRLTLDEWKYLSCNNDCQNSNILQTLNEQINQTKFELVSDGNLPDTNIILALYFHNFLQQSGYQAMEVVVSNKQIELFCNITFPNQPIYKQKANYEILLFPYLYNSTSQQIQISENMNVTLQLQLCIESVLVQSLSQNASTNSYSIFKLDTQSLIINKNYQIILSATDNLEFNYTQQMEFVLHEKNPVIYIVGGSRQIGYNQIINLGAVLLNNLTELIPQWNCLNLGDNQSCRDQEGNLIQLNNSFSNALKQSTFPQYSVIQFNTMVHTQNTIATDSVIVMIIEDSIPQILLQSNIGIKTGPVNYNDIFYLNFTYSDININPDLLLYSGTFYYNQEIISQVQFKYIDVMMSFWDYFDTNHYNKINFKFTIYNANYPVASTYTFQLSINKSPQNCKITTNVTEGFALADYFDINVINCQDEDQPLQYKFFVYYSEEDIQSDYSIGNVIKGQQLSQFSYSNQMISFLTGQKKIIIMIIVKDQLEGISNYTLNLNISLSDTLQLNYSSIIQESMLKSNLKLIIRDFSIIQKHFQIYNSFSLLNLDEIYSCLSKLQENQLLDDVDQINILLLYSQLYSFGLVVKSQEINSQFQLVNKNLGTIQDQIRRFRTNIDSEDSTLVKYSQKQLNEQIQFSAKILNNLQSANLKLEKSQGRLLVVDDANSSKQLFVDSLSIIENSLSSQQVVNSNTLTVNQSEFQISTSKLSQKQLDLLLGAVSNQTDQYKYSQTKITTNPYFQDSDFLELVDLTANVLYIPSLTQLASNEAITQLDKSIDYIFDINQQNNQEDLIYECASKISDIWSVNVCKTVDGEDSQMICRCNILSAITLIDAVLDLAENLVSLFSYDTLFRISQFEYFHDIFTYTLIVETIIFLIIILRSHLLDLRQNEGLTISKVFPTITRQPELIIHIDHIENDGHQHVERIHQMVGIQEETILSTKNNIPADFQILNGNRIRYPTLYQFNSKSQLRRDSEILQIEKFEEKATLSSRLALQQEPITILELNQDMGDDTPVSILRTPNKNLQSKSSNQLYEDNHFIENQTQVNNIPYNINPNALNQEQRESKTNLSFKSLNFMSKVQSKIQEIVGKVETPVHEELYQNRHKSFIAELNSHHVQLSIGFLSYIKNHHKLLNILYRYDLKNPRISRATLLYVSILGQMAVLTFFGKIMSLNTILALSLLQSVFGFVYKTLIFYSIKSKITIFNYLGFNLSIVSFCLFYFIILASISEYQSQEQSNFWGFAYLSNLFLDLIVYALLMQTAYFTLFVKYGTKPFIKKIGKVILPAEEYEFFYGDEAEIDQVDQTQIH